MAEIIYRAKGRRKTAVARVVLKSGTGQIEINKRPIENYFNTEILQMVVRQPIELAGMLNKMDVKAAVNGGGLAGQAGAVRHSIARALSSMDLDLRQKMKSEGFLTRDPRMKERKKYGLRGARKRCQYSKR